MKMSKHQCLNSIFIISRIIRKKRIKIKINKKVSNLVKKNIQMLSYISLNRGTTGKKIRRCKKRRQPSVTFRSHRDARSINYIQGKNSPSKFCATARENRGSCSPRSRVGRTSRDRERERTDEGEERRGEKKREETRRIYYRFFKQLLLPFPVPFVFFPSSRIATFFFPSRRRLSLPSVSFCFLRYEEYCIYAAVVV